MGGTFISPNLKKISTRIDREGNIVSVTVTGGEPEIKEKTKEEKVAELKAQLAELEKDESI